MQRALALCYSDHTHRDQPKSYSKLKGVVTDLLEYQRQNCLKTQKEKGPGERQSDPSHTSDNQT